MKNRDAWRAWLEKNREVEAGVWLIFPKKETGKATISYDEAVEEALCFGWIDSIIRNRDETSYCRKFTPRKPGSKWSALNKRRVAKMIQMGRMTPAGLVKRKDTGLEDDYGRTPESRARDLVLPRSFQHALQGNPRAWENFKNLAPSYRRSYILWIKAAKTDKTREARLAEAVRLLMENQKLGLR